MFSLNSPGWERVFDGVFPKFDASRRESGLAEKNRNQRFTLALSAFRLVEAEL
jgi:hypothetical protein